MWLRSLRSVAMRLLWKSAPRSRKRGAGLASRCQTMTEEIRASWARMERLAASPATVSLVLRLATELDVRAVSHFLAISLQGEHRTVGYGCAGLGPCCSCS